MARFTPLPAWATAEQAGVGSALGYAALAAYVALLALRQRFTSAGGRRGREAREAKAGQTFYASLPMIAAVAGMGRATAFRAIKKLEAAGLVDVMERGGRGAANVYRVHDCPTGGLTVKQGRISTVLAASHSGTRSSQIETPVRSEVRSDIQEGNRDGERLNPIFNQSTKKGKEPDRATLIEGYRAYMGRLNGDAGAVAGVRYILATKLRVSEEEAGALLNGGAALRTAPR